MTDRLTKAQRSALMSRIKGRGNSSTEVVFARLLRQNSITGWRRHMSLPGSPDFAFPAHKVAIFLDGCFWHGCPRHFKAPSSNRRFWSEKIRRNRARDRRDSRRLRSAGWRVVRFWEHDLKASTRATLASRLLHALKGTR
jgi:DNA mismatch endonuclease (patch repair protein)